MDGVDRRLLDVLQRGLPLCARPFAAVADEVGISEEDCLRRVTRLKEEGIIRRLGGVFSTRALGFHSALVAMVVPPEDLDRVAAVVSEYPEVTHNYARQGRYNLWFTLVTGREADARALLDEIRSRTRVEEVHLVPAGRVFKIRAHFPMGATGEEAAGYA
ncbi:MAG: AsnC family transcriptional regulator [Bacillota bacterium]|nr:AsnC family transcriptional regulator [Bacillota bacterium]